MFTFSFVQSMHCLFSLKMFVFFCLSFYMLCSTVFKFLFSFLFFCLFPLSSHPLFFLNRSFTNFFNLISASLCLYLYIVTMGSCIHFYSISNMYFHERTIQNRVHKFSATYNEIPQDSAHIFPVSKYPLQHNGLTSYQTPKFLNPFQGGLQNPVWLLTSTSI